MPHEMYDNVVTPKYPLAVTDGRSVFIKGLYSIIIYLGLGYLLLGRWDLLLIIIGVVILHEAGHFIAMKYYSYNDVSFLFLPFIGAWVQGSKHEISQRQSAIILLAGPLPGIVLGIILNYIDPQNQIYIGDVPLQFVAQLLIWANLLNLLPVYPLDGGQLLNRIFLNEEGRWSNLFLLASALFMGWIAIHTKFYVLLIFPAILMYRFFSLKSNNRLEKEIERTGINLNICYDELSDTDYWKIRNLLIIHISSLHNISSAPPYVYNDKEEKVARMVEAVLQRNLLMDVSVGSKLLLVLVWLLFLFVPWLFNIQFLLLDYMGKH